MNPTKDGAEISIMPEDIEGTYDYIADVKSMANGASDDQRQAVQNAIQSITENPLVTQLLAQEGQRVKIKELLIAGYENAGLNDAERFFEQIQTQDPNQPQDPSQQGQPQQAPQAPQPAPKQPFESINYKDAPDDIKRQIEQQAGLQPSQMPSMPQPQPAQATQPQM
jgi:hypothetical protein